MAVVIGASAAFGSNSGRPDDAQATTTSCAIEVWMYYDGTRSADADICWQYGYPLPDWRWTLKSRVWGIADVYWWTPPWYMYTEAHGENACPPGSWYNHEYSQVIFASADTSNNANLDTGWALGPYRDCSPWNTYIHMYSWTGIRWYSPDSLWWFYGGAYSILPCAGWGC